MKKETIYILGGVALVGVAYYLYNKNKPTPQTNSSGFANATGIYVKNPIPLKTGSDCSCSPSPCPTGWVCTAYLDENGARKCACAWEQDLKYSGISSTPVIR